MAKRALKTLYIEQKHEGNAFILLMRAKKLMYANDAPKDVILGFMATANASVILATPTDCVSRRMWEGVLNAVLEYFDVVWQ